ncbi:hypothetical protein FGB62_66g118 [Gracilaria domingensis]|nr:hypothetical protein FGB62_66g118 [Gracilaria domingensis]
MPEPARISIRERTFDRAEKKLEMAESGIKPSRYALRISGGTSDKAALESLRSVARFVSEAGPASSSESPDPEPEDEPGGGTEPPSYAGFPTQSCAAESSSATKSELCVLAMGRKSLSEAS